MKLDDLPTEILVECASQLRHHERAQLARVSKHFAEIAQPLLWELIELHPNGFHVTSRKRLPHGPPGFICMEPKSTRFPTMDHNILSSTIGHIKAQFLRTCGTLRLQDPARWSRLASMVRSLCLSTDQMQFEAPAKASGIGPAMFNGWQVIRNLINLEVLEVIGHRDIFETVVEMDDNVKPMAKLRSLRLRGYVPKSFAQSICSGAINLERLDFGILDNPLVSTMPKKCSVLNLRLSRGNWRSLMKRGRKKTRKRKRKKALLLDRY
jgi:hypothetical protein